MSTIQQRLATKFVGRLAVPGVTGLQMQFKPDGSMVFRFRYTSPLNSKKRLTTIGYYGRNVGQYTLLRAKEVALDYAQKVKHGIDPVDRVLENKFDSLNGLRVDNKGINPVPEPVADVNHMTIDCFINILVDAKARENISPKWMAQVKSQANDLKRVHGSLLVSDLTKAIGTEYIQSKLVKWTDDSGRERGGERAAGMTQAALSSLWGMAMDEDEVLEMGAAIPEILFNPWKVSKKFKKRIKAKVKEHYLDSDDLRPLLMRNILTLNDGLMRTIMIMLYSGCRPNEATSLDAKTIGMDWSEIRWHDKEWRIAKERMKAGRAHVVPLSDQFLRLLRAWHAADGQPASGPITRTAVTDNQLTVSVLDNGARKANLGFTPHVLRKSVRTNLARMGCTQEIREAISAHTPTGVGIHYDFYDHYNERRDWLQRWADRLDEICDTSIVKLILNSDVGLKSVS